MPRKRRGREAAENARWAAAHIMDQLEKRDEDGRQTAEAIFSYTAVADGCDLMAGTAKPSRTRGRPGHDRREQGDERRPRHPRPGAPGPSRGLGSSSEPRPTRNHARPS